MKRIIFLTIICITSAIIVSAQPKEITADEHNRTFREALDKGRGISRRQITQRESYREGKLYSTEEFIYEHVMPGKMRYVHSEKFADRTWKIELIHIDKTYYCRRDDGEWKKSATWCADGSVFGLPGIVSSKFTVEKTNFNNQSVRLFEEYTTYKNIYSANKDKEGLSYWKSKFWINEGGLIVRQEGENGLLEPAQIRWKKVDTYEYNPKDLKIEAPILSKDTKQ